MAPPTRIEATKSTGTRKGRGPRGKERADADDEVEGLLDPGSVQWTLRDARPVRQLDCRACGQKGPGDVLGRLVWPLEKPRLADLIQCGTCGSINVRDEAAPDYSSGDIGALTVRFYVEQGAGVDFLAEQAEIISHRQPESYCEIGCGFGFSLDYARQARGWRVRGVDPSPSARTGKQWLGLPIESRYSTPESPPGGGPYDVVAAYEVIEHVEDVPGFLASALAALKPDGTLLLTTPNGAAIRPDCPAGMLLAILSPGFHLTHFSADGLERALRAAGLHHVEIRQEPMTLRAAASRVPLDVDWSARLPRDVYRRYLRERLEGVAEPSPLFFGLAGRDLREACNAGDWDAAFAPLNAYREALLARYQLDLFDPAQIERAFELALKYPGHKDVGERSVWGQTTVRTMRLDPFEVYAHFAPFNLGSVLYFQAMRHKLHTRDMEAAEAGFRVADTILTGMRVALRWLGSEDGEAEVLQGEARLHWVRSVLDREGLAGLGEADLTAGLDPVRAARLALTVAEAAGGTVSRSGYSGPNPACISADLVHLAGWQGNPTLWLRLAAAKASPEREEFLREAVKAATGEDATPHALIAGCLAASALAATCPAEAIEAVARLEERMVSYLAKGSDLPAEFPAMHWRTEADVLGKAVAAGAGALLTLRARHWREQAAVPFDIAWMLGMYQLNTGLDYREAARLFALADAGAPDGASAVRARVHRALALASLGEAGAAQEVLASSDILREALTALGLNDAVALLRGRMAGIEPFERLVS